MFTHNLGLCGIAKNYISVNNTSYANIDITTNPCVTEFARRGLIRAPLQYTDFTTTR